MIISPTIKDRLVSVYIENRPFPSAIEMMAKSNGLIVEKDMDDVYYLSKSNVPQVNSSTKNGNRPNTINRKNSNKSIEFKLELNGNG